MALSNKLAKVAICSLPDILPIIYSVREHLAYDTWAMEVRRWRFQCWRYCTVQVGHWIKLLPGLNATSQEDKKDQLIAVVISQWLAGGCRRSRQHLRLCHEALYTRPDLIETSSSMARNQETALAVDVACLGELEMNRDTMAKNDGLQFESALNQARIKTQGRLVIDCSVWQEEIRQYQY